jgi:DNA-directed RNA polymerase beta' subunit
MNIELFNIDDFVKINKLQEVTDPMLFMKGQIPSPNGLLSTDIFGVSVTERKQTFAYINLYGRFLHPHVFKLIKRMDNRINYILQGTKKYVIEKGLLVENEEQGETGLEFLYRNWESIKWEKNSSLMRSERIDLLNIYPKDVLFMRKWIIQPAFYRDVNFQNLGQGKLSHHEINNLYSKLMRYASMIKSTNDFDFVLYKTRTSMQNLIVEIYDLLQQGLTGSNGLIRKNLLGKSVDYGSRSVISAPNFNADSPDDLIVDFYHTGVPLGQACVLFTPFIVTWISSFFKREFERRGGTYEVLNSKTGEIEMYELDSPELYYDEDYIRTNIDLFVHTPSERFKLIEVPVKEKNKGPVYFTFVSKEYEKGKVESESSLITRQMTWTDLLYIAACEVTEDKHVYITRYPFVDYFGMLFTKIHILSTRKTKPVYIGNTLYKHYPIVDLNKTSSEVSTMFVDTIQMSNLYLSGTGGDYDGDQVSVRGIFTQEANKEAERIMYSKTNLVNIYGDNMRHTSNEGAQTLYTLTKFEDK